jgi:hypothetical protein
MDTGNAILALAGGWASYHVIQFLVPGDIKLSLTKDAVALVGATYIGFTLYNIYNK